MSLTKLPYFDSLLKEFDQGNTEMEEAFGRHVHWGYWPDPQSADGTITDFNQAAEALSKLVCDAAEIQGGMKVLDCGCGFGGTIAHLNERFSSLDLIGLNIDERQLQRARQKVAPLTNNKIEFIQGNACQLPFPDASFDIVTAVECIFHFPSREAFFSEAARVLRPGGRLSLSDFVSASQILNFIPGLTMLTDAIVANLYGTIRIQSLQEYAALAKRTGFQTLVEKNITAQTLPTFTVIDNLVNSLEKVPPLANLPNTLIEWAQRSNLVLYYILTYKKL
ncbi:MAG: class I SAM-dependent methyltransferase [Acaryochloris sp. RU_4_1]|nr:class I SAM-dependent methyltransferase [Acaryochloris sp. RU_4_1]NJR55935.1 class I SAM-dependent methyltransferase [Acaryochloris sp. CRU_2_0]